MTQERPGFSLDGFAMVAVIVGLLAVSAWMMVHGVGPTPSAEQYGPAQPGLVIGGVVLLALTLALLCGFAVLQPNQARVLILFGRYVGTLRDSGFRWVNPFTIKKRVSLRAQNFQSERLKVNDARGNPIEIAAVVVWRVRDATRAVFEVESYASFVGIQSETAVRTLASHYPYDSHQDGEESLRGGLDAVCERLRHEVQTRLDLAGLEVMEARISHLAYAPEIAQTMLRRQQAEAVIAARQKLVEGAVGMVEMALKRLAEGGVVTLDEERKAAMVNNLMVSLVSEQATQPVINTGTMYA